VGKLVAAFVFFLAASALAIHEAKPSPPREEQAPPATPARVAPQPPASPAAPGPVVRDEVPPWVKYATPPPVAQKPVTRVIRIEPSTIEFESGGDIPDVVDRCPDQPDDRDDNDGCPEPDRSPLEDRIILID